MTGAGQVSPGGDINWEQILQQPAALDHELEAKPEAITSLTQFFTTHQEWGKDHQDLSQKVVRVLQPRLGDDPKNIDLTLALVRAGLIDPHQILSQGNTPLHLAALTGDEDLVAFLLQEGADPLFHNANKISPLRLAIENKHQGVVRAFQKHLHGNLTQDETMQRFSDWLVEGQDPPEIALLLYAKAYAMDPLDPECLTTFWTTNIKRRLTLHNSVPQFLQTHRLIFPLIPKDHLPDLHVNDKKVWPGSDNTTFAPGDTLLHHAVDNQMVDLAEAVLDAGADPNLRGSLSLTPFQLLIHRPLNDDIGQLLVKKMTLPKIVATFSEYHAGELNPLPAAFELNAQKTALELVKKGLPLGWQTDQGKNPLSLAFDKGWRDVALALLERGAAIGSDVQRFGLNTALQHGWEKVALRLIERKVSVENFPLGQLPPLHLACLKGLEEVGLLLISKVSDVNVTEYNTLRTPLHIACRSGSDKLAQALLENGAVIDAVDSDKNTPLHYACTYHREEVALLLLNEKANFQSVNRDGNTPLHLACREGLPQVVKKLIPLGVRYDLTNNNHFTPFLEAIQFGREEVALQLIEVMSDEDLKEKGPGDSTPLEWACFKGMERLASKLIDMNVEDSLGTIQQPNRPSETALSLACKHNLHDIALKLVDRKLNPNPMGPYWTEGSSPLHLACENGWEDVALALIENGAALDIENEKGFSPLQLACMHKLEKVALTLVEKGVNVNRPFGHRNNPAPLYYACLHGFTELALALIDKKANLNPEKNTTDEKHSPLHVACLGKYEEIALALVENGADLRSAVEPEGFTPLHLACGKGLESVARAMLAKDPHLDIATPNKLGGNALHYACGGGLEDLALEFIERLDDVDIMDRLNRTPLSFALWNSMDRAVERLIEKGASLEHAQSLKEEEFLDVKRSTLQGRLLTLKEVPPPPKVNYEELLEMFDAIPFTTSKQPGTINPKDYKKTSETLRKGLETIVKKCQAVKAGKQSDADWDRLYPDIIKPLAHVIVALRHEDDTDKRNPCLARLANLGERCSPGVLDEVNFLYRLYTGEGLGESPQESIANLLQHVASGCADQLVVTQTPENWSRQTVHVRNGIRLAIGDEVGISKGEAADDPYVWKEAVNKKEELLEEFFKLYTTEEILDITLENLLPKKDPLIGTDLLLEWFKDHMPTYWKKQIFDPILKEVDAASSIEAKDEILLNHGIYRRKGQTASQLLTSRRSPQIVMMERQRLRALEADLHDAQKGSDDEVIAAAQERLQQAKKREREREFFNQELESLIMSGASEATLDAFITSNGLSRPKGQTPEEAIEQARREDFIDTVYFQKDDKGLPTANISRGAVIFMLKEMEELAYSL